MELQHVRASRKRLATASAVVLCCLFCLGGAGANRSTQLIHRDPCAEAPTHPPIDDFELVPQQFSAAAPQYDLNNFMLNPQWGWQLSHPVMAGAAATRENYPDSLDPARCGNACFRDCTGPRPQTTMDRPEGCFMCNLAQRRKRRTPGHVNWFAAT